MNKVVAEPAQKLHKPKLYWIALVYASAIVVATVGLLFKLDELIDWIVRYGVGGGRAGVIAALVTAIAGVFSLPYLLRMVVSPLMRVLSFVCGFVAAAGWLLAAWWLEVNIGRSVAIWPMIFAYSGVLLAVASAWVIGVPMRPLKKRR